MALWALHPETDGKAEGCGERGLCSDFFQLCLSTMFA